jgi:hypothetical protein
MKVKQLIEILMEQPADADVSVWIDGERLELRDVFKLAMMAFFNNVINRK